MRWMILLMALATSARAEGGVLEDFTDPQGWSYVSDRVMGGVSDGGAQLARDGDRAYAALRGTVSTANNGGFIQIRRALDGLPAETEALILDVRGNGETYHVHLRTVDQRRPWDYFSARFVAGPDWRQIVLPLSDFRADRRDPGARLRPEDVRSIGLVAYGKDFEAALDVAAIGVR